jgi:hypothetical protein
MVGELTMLSRIGTLAAVTIALTGCADAPTGTESPGTSARADTIVSATSGSAASVARVTCEKDAVTLENPVVRARRDGVHLLIENRGDVWGFELRHVTDPNVAWNSGPIGPGLTRLTDAVGPGEVLVACLRARDPDVQGSGFHDDDAPTAALTIVDPDGLYVPCEPACGFGEQFRIRISADEDEEPRAAFRRVPGVRPTDELKVPKYPGSPQYWPTFIVFRDGVAVARIMGPHDGDEWELLVNACPGSGIATT